jgi:cation diffusion facilitator CzcD-associated flavoprotein CzcO
MEPRHIDCITSHGIRTKDGKDIPLDVSVYATGYYAYWNMKKALTFGVKKLPKRPEAIPEGPCRQNTILPSITLIRSCS